MTSFCRVAILFSVLAAMATMAAAQSIPTETHRIYDPVQVGKPPEVSAEVREVLALLDADLDQALGYLASQPDRSGRVEVDQKRNWLEPGKGPRMMGCGSSLPNRESWGADFKESPTRSLAWMRSTSMQSEGRWLRSPDERQMAVVDGESHYFDPFSYRDGMRPRRYYLASDHDRERLLPMTAEQAQWRHRAWLHGPFNAEFLATGPISGCSFLIESLRRRLDGSFGFAVVGHRWEPFKAEVTSSGTLRRYVITHRQLMETGGFQGRIEHELLLDTSWHCLPIEFTQIEGSRASFISTEVQYQIEYEDYVDSEGNPQKLLRRLVLASRKPHYKPRDQNAYKQVLAAVEPEERARLLSKTRELFRDGYVSGETHITEVRYTEVEEVAPIPEWEFHLSGVPLTELRPIRFKEEARRRAEQRTRFAAQFKLVGGTPISPR